MDHTVIIEKIVNGGQAIGTLASGKKALVWGGLPGETVDFNITKKRSKLVEGVVSKVITPSNQRVNPVEPDSYLSTSPWQIMNIDSEQAIKSQLIKEAFELHQVSLDQPVRIYTDAETYAYRNKLEFSWYSDFDEESEKDSLDLAFFRRGSRGKVIVNGSALARPEINQLAVAIRDLLRTKNVSARSLKTLIVRSTQTRHAIWQLYVKDHLPELITAREATELPAQGGEVIFSNPQSPASVITERLASFGDTVLVDDVLGVPFRYSAEGFFQVNLPVYEQSLKDMKQWVDTSPSRGIVDLYSGVGSIGLTIGGDNPTLVEINEHAVREMRRNIEELNLIASAILAPSEQALEHITSDKTIIVDPPRAGLHPDVVARLLETSPARIIYLSCNPVTQARDTALLLDQYRIVDLRGYNFFPRTPHIESLVVLDKQH